MDVAEATGPALCEQQPLPMVEQISEGLTGVGVAHHGTDGHAQHDVVGARTVLVGATAMLAVARLVAARVAVVDQGVDVAVGERPDAATAPAVAAIGAALRDELLAPERHDAVAAVAGHDLDACFVEELHALTCIDHPVGRGRDAPVGAPYKKKTPRWGAGLGVGDAASRLTAPPARP